MKTKQPTDITNQVFGAFTATRFVYIAEGNHAIWEFRCSCGTLQNHRASKIKALANRGVVNKPNCGCMTSKPKKAVVDISNQKFGSLTAVSPSHQDSKGHWYWNYSCICGNTHVARHSTIKYRVKLTKNVLEPSCGCLNTSIVTKHGHRALSLIHI